jgi:ribonuclease T2
MLVVALLACCAVAVAAQTDPCGGDDYGTAGQFDFYVFAQSWPAQFCQAHQSWPGCSSPTQWQAHNLTLHGMWPNYNQPQSGHSWPQCCQSQYGSDIDPQVAAELMTEFQTYWPNEEDPSGGDLSNSLWNHEWGKHGTCSGLDQKTYFSTAMNVELSMPTPDVITQNIGNSCALSDLQAAYGAQQCDEGGDCIAGFNCQSQNGQLYLAGVTTCWDTTFTQITCPAAVLSSQGKQCTDSTVYIQSF